jgi:hypothetical protein
MEGVGQVAAELWPRHSKGAATGGNSTTGTNVPLRAHLTQYILSGHTGRLPDLNMTDQFFTGLSDQLLTTGTDPTKSPLASVETKLRKGTRQ